MVFTLLYTRTALLCHVTNSWSFPMNEPRNLLSKHAMFPRPRLSTSGKSALIKRTKVLDLTHAVSDDRVCDERGLG